MQAEQYSKLVDKQLQNLPKYVYYYTQQPNLSVSTVYQYLSEYNRFFTWLRETPKDFENPAGAKICSAKSNKEIPLTVLENLKASQVQQYLQERTRIENRQNTKDSKVSLNRTINALRSLYHYLTVVSDLNDGEPYFYRNVMLKIPLFKGVKESIAYRNVKYGPQLYMNEKKFKWIEFIDKEYINTISKHAAPYFLKNKERDLAIITLLLATGVRISELVNLNLKDLNKQDKSIIVIRKGGKKDAALIADWAIPYLISYLEIRQSRYNPEKQQKALFLTKQRGIGHRINSFTIENLIDKYSTAFPEGSRTTPHKLRHSLGTEIYEKSKDVVAVATQLGHTGLSATDQYIQQANEDKQRKILNETNPSRK